MTLPPQEPTEHVCQGLWRIPLRSATLPPFTHTNAYLIARNGAAVLVDPGAGDGAAIAMLRDRLEPLGVKALQAILLTHTHSDHIAGVGAMRRAFGMPPVFVHPLERDRITEDDVLAFGEHIRVGDSVIEVLHTPGHSPGGFALRDAEAGVLFSGDTLFNGGPGATGRSFSSFTTIIDSIRDRLLPLPDDTVVHTGHGDDTRIGDEAPHLDEWIARGH